MKIMSNLKNADKRKPAQGGLRGVLDYIQTAGNLVKGDAIALLKVDPLIRLYSNYNKTIHSFQVALLKGKNHLLKGDQP